MLNFKPDETYYRYSAYVDGQVYNLEYLKQEMEYELLCKIRPGQECVQYNIRFSQVLLVAANKHSYEVFYCAYANPRIFLGFVFLILHYMVFAFTNLTSNWFVIMWLISYLCARFAIEDFKILMMGLASEIICFGLCTINPENTVYSQSILFLLQFYFIRLWMLSMRNQLLSYTKHKIRLDNYSTFFPLVTYLEKKI